MAVGFAHLVGATSACGDRTGLLLLADDSAPDSSGTFDGAEEGEDGAFTEGVLCSLNAGPVGSCDAGPAAGPVQRCTMNFPVCTNTEFPGRGWGCCERNPPDNRYDCLFQQFLIDAGCQ
jgi:hypothetical protein